MTVFNIFSYLTCAVFSLFFVLPTHALEIEPFEPSTALQHDKQSNDNYRLVLSSLSRVQATTVPEHEVRLKGELERKTWSIEKQFQLNDVINHFAPQFDGLRTLYECKALDCGSNNFWANSIFQNARLVGRDKFQYYRVALKQDAGQSQIYVLYIIERGTKQIMVNLDILSSPQRFNLALNSASYIRQQLKSPSGWLAGFITQNNQLNTEGSKALLDVLNALPKIEKTRLYLIVHCYSGEQMADTLGCSQELAKQLSGLLTDINPIEAQGALAFSPEGKQPALRFVYWPSR